MFKIKSLFPNSPFSLHFPHFLVKYTTYKWKVLENVKCAHKANDQKFHLIILFTIYSWIYFLVEALFKIPFKNNGEYFFSHNDSTLFTIFLPILNFYIIHELRWCVKNNFVSTGNFYPKNNITQTKLFSTQSTI